MIDRTQHDLFLWQECGKDGIAEAPLALKAYSDVLEIRQRDRVLLVNPESVPDLVRALRELAKPKKEGTP
jgi:hypothetical protein